MSTPYCGCMIHIQITATISVGMVQGRKIRPRIRFRPGNFRLSSRATAIPSTNWAATVTAT